MKKLISRKILPLLAVTYLCSGIAFAKNVTKMTNLEIHQLYSRTIKMLESESNQKAKHFDFDTTPVLRALQAERDRFVSYRLTSDFDNKVKQAMDSFEGPTDKESERLEFLEARLSKIDEQHQVLKRLYMTTKFNQYLDFVDLTDDLINKRITEGKVIAPSNASASMVRIAASFSHILGGTVTFKDDANGAYFNFKDSEQLKMRKRIYRGQRDFDESYTNYGSLRYMVSFFLLKRFHRAYGLLKDWGIHNLHLEFKEDSKAKTYIKRDTLYMIVSYNKVKPKLNRDGAAVVEEFNFGFNFGPFSFGGDISLPDYHRVTNWWKYREYDPRSVVRQLEGKYGLPTFEWRKGVKSTIMTAGGAIIGSGASKADPVTFVTPTSDKSIKDNYYLQIVTPDEAAIENALLESGKKRIRHDYNYSFILEEAARFSNIFTTIEHQNLTSRLDERALSNVIDGSEYGLSRDQENAILISARLSQVFESKTYDVGKKVVKQEAKKSERLKNILPSSLLGDED